MERRRGGLRHPGGPFLAAALAHPRWGLLRAQLRTARANGIPLSTLLHGGRPKWRRTDRALQVALTLYEDSLCTCGHPRDRAWNDDSDGHWEVAEHICQACAARDRARTTEGKRPDGSHVGIYDADPDRELRPMA
ncbi:hypothetical protein [Pseudokineococcus lusitanus]|uniref:hypothetical protein n=1 Tax=Pseudokineococcus lusitanus TaxID=763993 RepID=UPI000F469558|nr:hypothetical protein [Pseudokineococcus lusitanus]